MEYEIHITVEGVPEIESFRHSCVKVGVKPICIYLSILQDFMTSSRFHGNDQEVFKEVERISESLSFDGFKVIRKKVETSPFHQLARGTPTGDRYFEAHLPVTLQGSQSKALLKELVTDLGAHCSSNELKPGIAMVTYRSKEPYLDFVRSLNKVESGLEEMNYKTRPFHIEFALYDTNLKHDLTWIGE